MKEEIGLKLKRWGTGALAWARAVAQAGGADAVEAETGLKAKRLYQGANPDGGKEKLLSYDDARRFTKITKAVALAEDMAECAGGAFLDLQGHRGAGKTSDELLADFVHASAGITAAHLEGADSEARLKANSAALRTLAALQAALLRERGGA